ncbi:hypothetical protein EG68_08797 [Paragonimus skrjabini miyazakii]|uniref:Uncharacterized protein n=1 Tax=Paragonimus skrjabini miyazakii TaxID=59628 RepID=A0A8S9YTJ0_9TREM|nr:hypothetical protein EG68_08797 [Paragonimus skrjabini miyazakii]
MQKFLHIRSLFLGKLLVNKSIARLSMFASRIRRPSNVQCFAILHRVWNYTIRRLLSLPSGAVFPVCVVIFPTQLTSICQRIVLLLLRLSFHLYAYFSTHSLSSQLFFGVVQFVVVLSFG